MDPTLELRSVGATEAGYAARKREPALVIGLRISVRGHG